MRGGLLAAAVVLAALPAFAQMTLSGKFEVTDTGSASYTIPISVVPGTAGLEPKLSLQYDSRGGNGLLGVGWSLAGLPAITRCGKTIAQDGAAGGVAYDANDRFCLDGQRLISISGTYGADGTEYRTERESFSKVVSYGSAGSGPAWFKVWTKAGLIMEFGNTADSRIEAQGKTSVRVWAINKTSDTKGNYFSVSYTEDNPNGEYRPARIDYTGNGSTAPTNSVRFVYEARPDVTPMYQAGGLIKATQRMTKIEAWHGIGLAREYSVAYGTDGVVSRSRIASLQLCDASAACMPPTTASYTTEGSVSFDTEVWAAQSGSRYFTGDFNGDGKSDVVYYINGTFKAHLSTGSGFTIQTWATGVSLHSGPAFTGTGDFNGDGLTDIGTIDPAGVFRMYLSTGTGFTMQVWPANFAPIPVNRAWAGDVNGDGKTDIIGYDYRGWLTVHISTGSSFTIQTWATGVSLHSGPAFMGGGDFNGDGLTDFASAEPSGLFRVYLSTGTAFVAQYWATDLSGTPTGRAMAADFNGDGMTDIVGIDYRGWLQMHISTGTGFVISTWATGVAFNSAPAFVGLGDFNSDGLTDVAGNDPTGAFRIYLSTGTAFSLQTLGAIFGDVPVGQAFTGDFNGDGRTDIAGDMYFSSGTSTRLYLGPGPSSSFAPQLVMIGNTASNTTLAYTSLGRAGAPYAKDTGVSACTYPCMDMQGPLYAVSEVKSSNGLGGEYRSTYRYAGAKADQHGRGFLGFRQMTVKDEQTGVEQVTTYRQDYPFTGLVASREKKLGTQLLNRSANSYSSTDLGGTRRYPFLTQSLEESWELSGPALPAVTTGYQYDAFGNATQVSISTGDGHSKTTTNTYSNDATNWLLGRLTRSEVTSTTPGN